MDNYGPVTDMRNIQLQLMITFENAIILKFYNLNIFIEDELMILKK